MKTASFYVQLCYHILDIDFDQQIYLIYLSNVLCQVETIVLTDLKNGHIVVDIVFVLFIVHWILFLSFWFTISYIWSK